MGENSSFSEASYIAIKEECDPMTGTGKHLAGEIPCSSEKSMPQIRRFILTMKYKEHVVKGDIHRSVLSALESIDHISKVTEMKQNSKVPHIIGKTKIEGYINLGMPLKYLPEDSNVEMKIYKKKIKEVPDDEYHHYYEGKDCVLFYVHPIGYNSKTEGAESRRIIRCKGISQHCYMCVFAPEGETIKNALHNDGRFLPLLENSEWDLVEDGSFYDPSFPVDKSLDSKKFKVGLRFGRDTKGTHKEQNVAFHQGKIESLAKTCDGPNKGQDSAKAESETKAYSNKEAASLVSKEEYLKTSKILPSALLQQYPFLMQQINIISDLFRKSKARLKEEKKFLTARKEGFGKVTNNSSLIKMQRKLIELSESVGYIEWDLDGMKGSATCFVLCENYVLTCHHVVNMIVGEGTDEMHWAGKISQAAFVTFSYEDRHPEVRDRFSLSPLIVISDKKLDFAVLELKENRTRIPAGLVPLSSPPPFNNLIYIIGHPNGESKSMDSCSVVSVMERQQNLSWNLWQREDYDHSSCGYENKNITCVHMYTPRSFSGLISNSDMVTYDTCFFHGSSGSPVFDHNGKLVALHSGGYPYKHGGKDHSIIEFGFSMLSILSKIKKKNKDWYESKIAPCFQNYPDREQNLDVEMESMEGLD